MIRRGWVFVLFCFALYVVICLILPRKSLLLSFLSLSLAMLVYGYTQRHTRTHTGTLGQLQRWKGDSSITSVEIFQSAGHKSGRRRHISIFALLLAQHGFARRRLLLHCAEVACQYHVKRQGCLQVGNLRPSWFLRVYQPKDGKA